MALSADLISQFVKVTKDDPKDKKESVVYGTIVYDGKPYVKLDGSDLLTPISTTTDVKDGERVTVTIENHTATVNGNISSPSARTDDVKEIGNQITEFEIVIADKVSTKELEAERGRIDDLVTENVTVKERLTATEADISDLTADNVTINEKLTAREAEIKKLETEKLDATAADIKFATIDKLEVLEGDFHTLESTYGEFKQLTTDALEAQEGRIDTLHTTMFDAESGDIKFANIDFSNIGQAAMEYFYAKSGLIEDVVVGDGTITGTLIGVTIKGDLIQGGTVVADKLVIKDSKDGLYYKLNFESGAFAESEEVPTDGLHGSVIVANSITAEKINVHDLVAFGATIGGFHISDGSIYSGVKETIDNTTRGIHMDNDGQFALGDAYNYLKFYKADVCYQVEYDAANDVYVVTDKVINNPKDGSYEGWTDIYNRWTTDGDYIYDEDIDGINKLFCFREEYKLEIVADSILFGSSQKTSASDLKALTEHVKIGTLMDEDTGYVVTFNSNTGNYIVDIDQAETISNPNGKLVENAVTTDGRLVYELDDGTLYCLDEKPCVELSEGDSDFKQVITNVETRFVDGGVTKTSIDTDGVHTDNVTINNELRHGKWIWAIRANGNYGLTWKEG